MHKCETINPARFYSVTWSTDVNLRKAQIDNFNIGLKNNFDIISSYFMLDNQLQNES
jgi:hypothetical protein